MIAIEPLLDAYVDMNILLMIICALSLMARVALRSAGLSHTYGAQSRLLQGMLVSVLASPLIVLGFAVLARTGLFGAPVSVNLSDFVVAQYLQGSFEMNPSSLEALLGVRQNVTSGMLSASSQIGLITLSILAVGFTAFAARLALSARHLGQIIATSHPWRRFGNLHLRLCDTACVPFSTRTLRKRIVVIPSAMLAQNEDLKIALAHEFQHFRQNDIAWEILLETLKPFFFWNPAYYLIKYRIEVLRELACDQRLLARGRINARAYCRCLLRVGATSLRPVRLFAVEAPRVAFVQLGRSLFGRKRAPGLRRRVASLIEGRIERNPTRVYALLMAPLLAVTVLASVAIQKPTDWSQDRIMLSTIVNLERLAVRNGQAGALPAGF